MITEELSILGYCCTGSFVSARQPASTIIRFTTIASTGCLMKMSVNERICMVFIVLPIIDSLETDRLPPLVLSGSGTGNGHERRLAQFERSRCRHPVTCREPCMNDNLVSEHRAAFDLLDVCPGSAVLVLRDDKDLITLRAFAQRIHRHGNGRARGADRHTDAHRRTLGGRVGCALDS